MSLKILVENLVKEAALTKKGAPLFSECSAGQWWKENYASSPVKAEKVEHLVELSFRAPNFSCAFNVAYQFALRQVFEEICPSVFVEDNLACLCVSERGGNSPKSIETTFTNKGLTGFKTFVTCSDTVDQLLVMFDDQRNGNQEITDLARKSLKIGHFPVRGQSGLKLIPSGSDKFLPDIKSGKLELNDCQIAETDILSGDAHNDYSKPFSVVEGVYIKLAALSLLLRLCIQLDSEKAIISDIVSLIISMKANLAEDLFSPLSQLILDANSRKLEALLGRLDSDFSNASDSDRSVWQRDRVIFFMDIKLRAKRLEDAWQHLSA